MAASTRPPVPSILLVTGSRRLVPGGSPADRAAALDRQAREAFAAGVDAVQLREPDLDAATLFHLARSLALLGRVIVTERADVAIAAGASGLHLRADGPEPARVRAILPPHMTLSRAIHDEQDARRFGSDAALDWLLAGTAFESESKPGRTPLGASGVHTLAHASALPLVAIGGVTVANARQLRDAGAAGVAGIGLFLGAIQPEYVDRLRERSLE